MFLALEKFRGNLPLFKLVRTWVLTSCPMLRVGRLGMHPMRYGISESLELWANLQYALRPLKGYWGSPVQGGLAEWSHRLFCDVIVWFEKMVLAELSGCRQTMGPFNESIELIKRQLKDSDYHPAMKLAEKKFMYDNHSDLEGEDLMLAYYFAVCKCNKLMLGVSETMPVLSVVRGRNAKISISSLLRRELTEWHGPQGVPLRPVSIAGLTLSENDSLDSKIPRTEDF